VSAGVHEILPDAGHANTTAYPVSQCGYHSAIPSMLMLPECSQTGHLLPMLVSQPSSVLSTDNDACTTPIWFAEITNYVSIGLFNNACGYASRVILCLIFSSIILLHLNLFFSVIIFKAIVLITSIQCCVFCPCDCSPSSTSTILNHHVLWWRCYFLVSCCLSWMSGNLYETFYSHFSDANMQSALHDITGPDDNNRLMLMHDSPVLLPSQLSMLTMI
jgi:hypothetical protein